MRRELLLNWASEIGEGSLTEWRAGATWAIPGLERAGANRMLAGLAALGHVEVDWEAGDWRVAEPALTLLPDAGGHGFLTGARTASYRQQLESDPAPDIDALLMFKEQSDGPDSCYVSASSEGEMEELADIIGARYSHSVPLRLSPLLPGIGQMIADRSSLRGKPDLGLERFEVETLSFAEVESDSAPGLYRYDSPGRPELRWIDDEDSVYKVDLSVGTHAEISRVSPEDGAGAIQWRPAGTNGNLEVRLTAPLPLLHSRAATLCSGRIPRRQGRVLIYPNVPLDLSERIAATLGGALHNHGSAA